MRPDVRGNLVIYGRTRDSRNGHISKEIIAIGDLRTAENLGMLKEAAHSLTSKGYYQVPRSIMWHRSSPYCVSCGLSLYDENISDCLWDLTECPGSQDNNRLTEILAVLKNIQALLETKVSAAPNDENNEAPS